MNNINDVGGNIWTKGTSSGFFGGSTLTPHYWTPSQLQDVSLWFDAADTDTLTLSTGNRVVRWNSKGFTTYYATQTSFSFCPTFSAQSLNGLPIIKFDSSNTNRLFLSGDSRIPFLSGGFAIIVYRWIFPTSGTLYNAPRVLSYWDNTNDGWMLDPVSASPAINSTHTRLGIRKRGAALFANHRPNSVVDNINFHLHEFEWGTLTNSSSSLTYYDSISSTTSFNLVQPPLSSTNGLRIHIGADQTSGGNTLPSNFFNGDIAEIIMVNGYSNNVILSACDRYKLEGYLAWKWNTVSQLPANHPYKTSRPLV